jgi:hypothetical protein
LPDDIEPGLRVGDPGFSVVELLIALTLMAFLTASLLTVITTGSGAFQKVLDYKTAQSDARIAVSYISVKLRQHSSRGRVSIVPSDSISNVRNVLKIEEGPGVSTGESRYIYFEEAEGGGTGRLVEKNSVTPRVDDPAGAFKIADISDFDISYADGDRSVIDITVVCDTPDERVTREVSITLRSF